jgi:hypothetical protein
MAVHPRPGAPAPASLVSGLEGLNARLRAASPEHLRFELDSGDVETDVTVAVAWSPKWRGRLDGDRVRLGRTLDGLVRLELPRGRHELALDYGGDGWGRAKVAVTALTALVLLGAQVMSRIFSRTA